MRYSKLFGKTEKEAPNDATLASHKLLHQAGFVRESTAGRYYFLPLGIRVHQKIIDIVRDEMNKAGGQELVTPVLHPLELWKETNRTKTTGFELMVVKDRRDAEFALGGTAEEMMVDLVRKFPSSYKDVPFNIYQFSTKFRDELRARGGLLRVREFTMKDAYSFNLDAEDFKVEYKNMWETYIRIFNRLGLDVRVVEADNGYIGGEYSHEFQVESEVGEGRFFVSEDGKYCAHEDVAKFKLEDVNPDEEVKEFQIIDQPENVRTMEEFEKFYNRDTRYFLKNVVYRNREGDIIIATLRGDLKVNKTKLESLIGMVGQLEDATAEDLAAIGTKTGYVHSWDHDFITPRKATTEDRNAKVIYIADQSLKTVKNFIGGQKEEKTDSINVNYGRDFKHEVEGDIAMAQEGFLTVDTGSKLIEKKGIEVGNIFQLGYHYSSLMKDAEYTDANGDKKKYYMGCYGIGIGRTLATIVEKFHDEKGIVWPKQVAPFQVHLIGINLENEDVKNRVNEVYQKLLDQNIEVLFDDREEVTAGVKFADSDLIGIPYRVLVSKKSGDQLELKKRDETDAQLVSLDDLLKLVA